MDTPKDSNTQFKFDFVIDNEPDVIETASGFAPNYGKFIGWDAEEVLVFLNMD